MRPRLLAPVAAIVALSIAARAAAIDYCVDRGTGAVAHSGVCPGSPWATLGPSQSFRFASGDRVLIAAGRYVHPLTAWYMTPGVSWIGAGPDQTVIVFNKPTQVPFVRFRTGTSGSGPPTDLRPAPFTNTTLFSAMTLRNEGQATVGVDVAVTSGDSAPSISNVWIEGFPIGVRLHPSSDERVAASTHAVLTQSVIRDADDTGLLFFADVFYARAVTEASTVTNTTATAGLSAATVKTLVNDMRDAGMAFSRPVLTNLTLVGGLDSAVLLVSYYDDGSLEVRESRNAGMTDAQIKNAILTGASRYGIEEWSAFTEPALVTNNCLGGNALGDYRDEGTTTRLAPAVGTGNIGAVPLLVDIPAGDLHQLAASPTIDRIPAAQAPAIDLDVQSRPQGSSSDMGADEFFPCTANADASATRQAPPCTGGTTTLDASRSTVDAACTRGLAFEWFDGGVPIGTGATLAVSPASPTTYTLRCRCLDPAFSACFAETSVGVQPSTSPPAAGAGGDQSACVAAGVDATFTLEGTATASPPSTIASVRWTAPEGRFFDANAATTSFTVTGGAATRTITVTFTVTDNQGCVATDSLDVTMLSAPVVSIVPVPVACVPLGAPSAVVDVTAAVVGGTAPFTWTWTSTRGSITGGQTASLSIVPDGTTWTVDVTAVIRDASGCSGQATQRVVFVPQPEANSGPDGTLCFPEGPASIAIAATGSTGEAPLRYAWTASSGTIADPTARITSLDIVVGSSSEVITLSLEVRSAGGECVSSDERVLTVGPGPVAVAGADTSECVDSGTVGVPLDGTASSGDGTLTFRWATTDGTIADPSSATSELLVDVAQTTKIVTVSLDVGSDRFACVATDWRQVTLRPRPVANPGGPYSVLQAGGPDTEVPLDGSASLGEAPLSHAWTTDLGTFRDTGLPTSSLESPILVVPNLPMLQRARICVTISSGNGCTSSDACTTAVILLAPVNPPNDVSPTLRVRKGPPTDVVLSWDDASVDATHDQATVYEISSSARGCGPFTLRASQGRVAGSNEARDPILAAPPAMRCYFVRSVNDGGASDPRPRDGSGCR